MGQEGEHVRACGSLGWGEAGPVGFGVRAGFRAELGQTEHQGEPELWVEAGQAPMLGELMCTHKWPVWRFGISCG